MNLLKPIFKKLYFVGLIFLMTCYTPDTKDKPYNPPKPPPVAPVIPSMEEESFQKLVNELIKKLEAQKGQPGVQDDKLNEAINVLKSKTFKEDLKTNFSAIKSKLDGLKKTQNDLTLEINDFLDKLKPLLDDLGEGFEEAIEALKAMQTSDKKK